jgi:hypothetical protein
MAQARLAWSGETSGTTARRHANTEVIPTSALTLVPVATPVSEPLSV